MKKLLILLFSIVLFFSTKGLTAASPSIPTFAGAYGSLTSDDNYESSCDFDGDGDVDAYDLADFADEILWESLECDSEPIILTTGDGVQFVRTPYSCFENLPDFPYEAKYVEIDGLRQAYVDEGPADADPVLLLHGQPSWSYLYRKMIPVLVAGGHRVIAMDHIGMGRSDKPIDIEYYSYLGHIDRLEVFIQALSLQNITLFCQDWGSLIGLHVAGEHPGWFARIVVGDGTLPVVPAGIQPYPPVENPDELNTEIVSNFASMPPQQFPFYDENCNLLIPVNPDYFADWMVYAMTGASFHAAEVVEAMTYFDISPEEEAAYDAPFPSRIYMAGPRVFPSLVNDLGGVNFDAWAGLTGYEKPFLTIWASNDPGNLGRCETQDHLINNIPGAAGQPHTRLPEASHFLQDDQGAEIARLMVEFIEDSIIEARIDEIFGDAPYGELNREQARRMVDVVPEEDGPFYMLNLIAYRDNAEYPDGRQTELTGEEANSIYGQQVFPILLEIGARPVFVADVAHHLIDPDMAEWDEVGIVRYPGRAEFIAMIERQDFRAASIHKYAGVERTIVIVAHEDPDAPPEDFRRIDLDALPFPPTAEDPVIGICHLLKYNEIAQYADGRETDLTGREAMDLYSQARSQAVFPLGVRPGLWLIPEGELIGDGRVWDEFRINLFPSQAAFDYLITTDTVGQANLIHREAAIADTYSVLTIPVINEFGYLEP